MQNTTTNTTATRPTLPDALKGNPCATCGHVQGLHFWSGIYACQRGGPYPACACNGHVTREDYAEYERRATSWQCEREEDAEVERLIGMLGRVLARQPDLREQLLAAIGVRA